MTYVFAGSPQDVISGFRAHIDSAASGGINADREFNAAVVCLVGLEDSQARGAPLSPAEAAAFREVSTAALTRFKDKISAYVFGAIYLAEGANDDEWYELCVRRSVIQILVEDYAGTALAEAVGPTDIEDLDVELRRVGAEQGPIPAPFIPAGLPPSHWWWHFPEATEEKPAT